MGRKKNPGHVCKQDLIHLFTDGDVKSSKKLSKNELVFMALDQGLISEEAANASYVRYTSTLPCYLHTHVKDPVLRDVIERYVQAYSQLYVRGSWLANLAAMAVMQHHDLPDTFPTTDDAVPFPEFLADENHVKHCFLPERWLLKQKPIHPDVEQAYAAHREQADMLLPDYGGVMSDCGWDNAVNHMGTSYLGNVKVQTITHLLPRLKKWVTEVREAQPGSNRDQVHRCIVAPLYPCSEVADADFEWAMEVRGRVGSPSPDQWLQKPEDLTQHVWAMHLWLQRRLVASEGEFALLPVSTLDRKYSYLDEKVLGSLVPTKTKKAMLELTKAHSGSPVQKVLGLTSQLFNKRRAAVRKQLAARHADKAKLKRKWQRVGHGCLPKFATVKMVKTDGVGLRITLEFLPKRPLPAGSAGPPTALTSQSGMADVKQGWDTGRVRLATSASSEGKVQMITRKAYYYMQRHERHEAWELSRRVGTPWGDALAAMSEAGGFRNSDIDKWTSTMAAFGQHRQAILQEQLVDKARALQRMRRFRWKKAFMDQRIKQLLRPALLGRTLAIGIGDGKFASTGKGELAVPTTAFGVALKRVIKMHGLEGRVTLRKICEFRTTMCCHRCHQVMTKLQTASGYECLRYRMCTNCAGTGDKRRHRDVNAAKNMLALLTQELMGCPRPRAFCRQACCAARSTRVTPT